jgi:hypothetical protein
VDSKIIGLARRARQRAIAEGDEEMVARQERGLYRAITEQQTHDAATRAAELGDDLSDALLDLVRLYRRDNPGS